jgi:hypothetical protein
VIVGYLLMLTERSAIGQFLLRSSRRAGEIVAPLPNGLKKSNMRCRRLSPYRE